LSKAIDLIYAPSFVLNHSPSSIPTVGFNMKKVTKGHVTLKW